MTDDSESLPPIVQVIGVAYTYKPSLAVRHHLTKSSLGAHSSQDSDFSYFYKGDQNTILGHNQKLYLRNDPATGEMARHWPEPELAILLGRRHSVIAYTLANDLTAISIEARGRTAAVDGTYEGKVWFKSGSLGPRFLPASAIDDAYKLEIGLTIERSGRTLYNQSYSTSRSLRSFQAIPGQIVNCFRGYNNDLPRSKRIMLDEEGFLAPGTVVMLGTGLIVSERHALQPGDETIISCCSIGELRNPLTAPEEE
jgi:2-dehydro-3-deoxy-D-arabinonate dehydratase